jgi:hypothetical protein
MAGVALLVQNATDRFETWSYTWTLAFLAGPGMARWLVGVVSGRRDLAASRAWLIAAGLGGCLLAGWRRDATPFTGYAHCQPGIGPALTAPVRTLWGPGLRPPQAPTGIARLSVLHTTERRRPGGCIEDSQERSGQTRAPLEAWTLRGRLSTKAAITNRSIAIGPNGAA